MSKCILLVEDDVVIRHNFVDVLESEGFTVRACSDRQSAEAIYNAELPDLALLDITLGDDYEGGFILCSALRARSETLPIIFLTSHSNDVDRISAMRLGADDYITKDISVDYLVVRIRALFRRIEALARQSPGSTVEAAKLSINEESLEAHWLGQRVDISLTQFWILRTLAGEPGRVWRPEELMAAANITVEPNTIVAHMAEIRRKIRKIDESFKGIKTERGVGYRWIG